MDWLLLILYILGSGYAINFSLFRTMMKNKELTRRDKIIAIFHGIVWPFWAIANFILTIRTLIRG